MTQYDFFDYAGVAYFLIEMHLCFPKGGDRS